MVLLPGMVSDALSFSAVVVGCPVVVGDPVVVGNPVVVGDHVVVGNPVVVGDPVVAVDPMIVGDTVIIVGNNNTMVCVYGNSTIRVVGHAMNNSSENIYANNSRKCNCICDCLYDSCTCLENLTNSRTFWCCLCLVVVNIPIYLGVFTWGRQ